MAPGMRMHPNTPNVRMVDQLRRLHGRGGTRLHGQRCAAAAPSRQGAGDGADRQAHRHHGYSARWRRLQGQRWLQPPRQHRRMDVADLRRCRSGRRRLGDRFLQLHHPAQSDAERPIRGHPGHDRARRRLQDRERSARPNSRPHLSRRLEGRSEKFDQVPRQGEVPRTRCGARQRQPVLEPHGPAA